MIYRYILRLHLMLILSLLFTSCGDVVQLSPYETELAESQSGLTQKNLARIKTHDHSVFSPFRFAVISDTHSFRDELATVVRRINRDPTIEFVVIPGDLTDSGLRKEFIWALDVISDLRIPYFVTIGNHDALTNGKSIFKSMFGEFNFRFNYKNVWFVFFNDNSWEFHDTVPDLDWVENTLGEGGAAQHRILISHVGLKVNRLGVDLVTKITALLDQQRVNLYINGHDHDHRVGSVEASDGYVTQLLNNGAVRNGYTIINVNETQVLLEWMPL